MIADKGITAKVQQGAWEKLIADFIHDIRAKEMGRGLLQIIGGAGEMLVKHFPVKTVQVDELPNHLIELDGPGYLS